MKCLPFTLMVIIFLAIVSCDSGSKLNQNIDSAKLKADQVHEEAKNNKEILKGLSPPEVVNKFFEYWRQGMLAKMLTCMKVDSQAYSEYAEMPTISAEKSDSRIYKKVIYGNVARVYVERTGSLPSKIKVSLVKNDNYWEIIEFIPIQKELDK